MPLYTIVSNDDVSEILMMALVNVQMYVLQDAIVAVLRDSSALLTVLENRSKLE